MIKYKIIKLSFTKKALFLYLLLGASANMLHAQTDVTGTVTSSADNQPLLGATVQVQGVQKGTSTDFDGRYTIEGLQPTDSLKFSYLGFESQVVVVGNRSEINIQLTSEASSLDELVIVGYGTQKKINLTGSVDVISSEQFENRPAHTVADMLKGASPNLDIGMGMRGGEPGSRSSWSLRGMGSINGNDGPLILIDGMEGDIHDIDPQSVESISVLKDASASAIYGAKAAFGVILITTKRGSQDGPAKIQYTNNLSWNSPIRFPSYVDSYTWATAYNEAADNSGIAHIYSEEQMERIKGYLDGTFGYEYDPENPIDNIWAGRRNGNANNNWPRILMADYSFSQKHHLNVSGGNENTQYYVAGSYDHQDGMYEYGTDFYKRYTLTSNVSAKVTDWLTFHPSVKYTNSYNNYPLGETTVGREHQFREMIKFAPMMPFYNLNGTIQSPLVRQQQGTGREKIKRNNFMIQLAAEIEPIEGWKTNVSYNFNYLANRTAVNPKPIPVELGTGEFGNIGKPNTGYSTSMYESEVQLANIVSSYEFEINGHNFRPLVGYEQQYKYYTSLSATGDELITESLPSLSTSLGEKTVDDRMYHWATQGVFGRFNYNYKEKYLLEISARYDGSSRFAKDSRWGFFPSASAGYVISSENFWDPIKPYVNMLKIRGSYGSLGNQNVGGYHPYLSTIPITNEIKWILDQSRPAYARAPGLVSNTLTWETITTLDIGMDASFLDNRLNATFDWYQRITSDMMGPSVSLPSALGASAPRTNNAKMETLGFEIALSWNDRLSPDFSYNVQVGLGDNQSRILEYENEKGLISTWYNGKVVGEIVGFVSDGLIQEVGEPMPDQSKYYANWGPGDMKYKDLNGDGIIDDGGRTVDDHGDLAVIGNSTPRYNMSINAGFKWKNWDFNMFWQGVGKRDWYPDARSTIFWGLDRSATSSGLYEDSFNLDYWRPADATGILGPNTDAYLPKPYFTAETAKNRQIQSRYILNAAYLRLKNLQIGYSLPDSVLKSIYFDQVRIYFSGENLLAITDLPGVMDPETVFASHPSFGGYDASGDIYPISRNLSFGLNLTF